MESKADRTGKLSPPEIAGSRLAALCVLVQAGIALLFAVLAQLRPPFLELGVMLVLAYFLYWLNPLARAAAIVLPIVKAGALGVALFMAKTLVWSVAWLVLPAWTLSAAFLLLLIGRPSRRRRIVAMIIFTLGVMALSFHLARINFLDNALGLGADGVRPVSSSRTSKT